MDKFLKRKTDTCNAGTQQDSAPGTSNVIKVKNKNLSKENTGKITFSMVFLGAEMKMLQNRSVLFVGRNLQMKQWFLINLCAT